MPEKTQYEQGTFCWTDLGTTDAAAAKRFYTEVFGWKANDVPAGPGMTYTMLSKDGKDVCALYPQQPGMPAFWLSYISVKDADEAAKKAESLGAKIMKPAFDVMDVGRMAVLQDPTGAAFAVWQPKKHAGARLIRETGAVCWNELMTNDIDKAGSFYAKLWNWKPSVVEMGGGMKYTLFKGPAEDAGGMMALGKDMAKVPPNWLVYFAVDHCDGTTNKAKSLGAKVIVQPTDIPNVGRFAVFQDPQGAAFGILQPLPRK